MDDIGCGTMIDRIGLANDGTTYDLVDTYRDDFIISYRIRKKDVRSIGGAITICVTMSGSYMSDGQDATQLRTRYYNDTYAVGTDDIDNGFGDYDQEVLDHCSYRCIINDDGQTKYCTNSREDILYCKGTLV